MKLTFEDIQALREAVNLKIVDNRQESLRLKAEGKVGPAEYHDGQVARFRLLAHKLKKQDEGVLWNVWSKPTVMNYLTTGKGESNVTQ